MSLTFRRCVSFHGTGTGYCVVYLVLVAGRSTSRPDEISPEYGPGSSGKVFLTGTPLS